MVAVASSMTETFASLVQKSAPLDDITKHLDALDLRRRIDEVREVGGALQAKLWEIARGKGAIDIAAFVEGTAKTNIYEGKNSLPLFTHFQKRFHRADSGEIAGYNHNDALLTLFVGPGYFTVEPADNGELLFDYTRIPIKRPPEWPAIHENKGLIAGIVYGRMQDYVRFVSKSTVIGAAFIGKKSRNSYFLLTRAA
jgi:hypothetical protein